MGAWIEIFLSAPIFEIKLVAPLMGAWIEIYSAAGTKVNVLVAPLMGAWIEMSYILIITSDELLSHPSWVR